jgi:hypothetical protein
MKWRLMITGRAPVENGRTKAGHGLYKYRARARELGKMLASTATASEYGRDCF